MKMQWLAVLTLLVCTLAWGAAQDHRKLPGGDVTTHGSAATAVSTGGGGIALRAAFDRAAVFAGGDGRAVLELSVSAPASDATPLRPADVIVVLDRSGSMRGDKMAHAREAMRSLITGLREQDRLALVSYAHHARLDFPLAHATPERKVEWSNRTQEIAARGGTNLAAGLDRALALLATDREAERSVRVLLLSDGLANEGDTSRDGLRGRAALVGGKEHTLSTIGVGLEFDEELLALLADAGTGNYHYIESTSGLDHIFATEFASARETVATGLRVAIGLPEGARVLDAAGYPLERHGNTVSFRPGSLFAGQRRRIGVAMHLPVDAERHVLSDIRLDYRTGGRTETVTIDEPLVVDVAAAEEEYLAGVDREGWARSVVIDEYNALRKRVSRAVVRGDRDEARKEIASFKDSVSSVNEALSIPEVDHQLKVLDELESQIDDSFRGGNASVKQKALGKTLHHQGIAGGRVGSQK